MLLSFDLPSFLFNITVEQEIATTKIKQKSIHLKDNKQSWHVGHWSSYVVVILKSSSIHE